MRWLQTFPKAPEVIHAVVNGMFDFLNTRTHIPTATHYDFNKIICLFFFLFVALLTWITIPSPTAGADTATLAPRLAFMQSF